MKQTETVNVSQEAPQCPFCSLSKDQVWVETDIALAFLDAFPISEGHTLVVPKRHTPNLFNLEESEFLKVWSLVAKVRTILKKKYHPDGFNIGVNEGFAGGQTVGHAHIHVIPRWIGDVPDPKGGIRCVIPHKARYW
jgi:diadenosine tetraphosphate (Ap4A) HIT family hydrolase